MSGLTDIKFLQTNSALSSAWDCVLDPSNKQTKVDYWEVSEMNFANNKTTKTLQQEEKFSSVPSLSLTLTALLISVKTHILKMKT